jgi:hypothetical protein
MIKYISCLIISVLLLFTGCSTRQEKEQWYEPEFELLEYYASWGDGSICCYVYIKNYEEKRFNDINFQKYILNLYDSIKIKNTDNHPYLLAVCFLKSDRYFCNKDDWDKIHYKKYKKDIIIRYWFDIKYQLKYGLLSINSADYYVDGDKKVIDVYHLYPSCDSCKSIILNVNE